MGLFDKIKNDGGFMNVIRCDEPSYLIWKCNVFCKIYKKFIILFSQRENLLQLQVKRGTIKIPKLWLGEPL